VTINLDTPLRFHFPVEFAGHLLHKIINTEVWLDGGMVGWWLLIKKKVHITCRIFYVLFAG
jgi:hypothetical protein